MERQLDNKVLLYYLPIAITITITIRGSEWGGGGWSRCRLSVKVSLLCRLSVDIFDLCRLSVNLS